jgi:hypothetical protein
MNATISERGPQDLVWSLCQFPEDGPGGRQFVPRGTDKNFIPANTIKLAADTAVERQFRCQHRVEFVAEQLLLGVEDVAAGLDDGLRGLGPGGGDYLHEIMLRAAIAGCRLTAGIEIGGGRLNIVHVLSRLAGDRTKPRHDLAVAGGRLMCCSQGAGRARETSRLLRGAPNAGANNECRGFSSPCESGRVAASWRSLVPQRMPGANLRRARMRQGRRL